MAGLNLDSHDFQLLAGGDYAELARRASVRQVSDRDVPWAIAGLTFIGRSLEAEGLLASREQRLTDEEKVAARFFLAVALQREGRIDKARPLFVKNFSLAKRLGDAYSKFFAAQGLAFFRYHEGRLPVAELWGNTALKMASGVAFQYGSVLALELLGHVQLTSGIICSGFRLLELAARHASELGNGAPLQAVEVSRTLYRATYGLSGTSSKVRQELESRLGLCSFEDSYTRAALTIELARTDVLAGRLNIAEVKLKEASEVVYRIDNAELEIEHNLCFAFLLRERGELHQALSIVRGARHRARQRSDLRPLLRVLGLEANLLQLVGQTAEAQQLIPEVKRLTRRTGSLIARRIDARTELGSENLHRPAEDHLGDLFDDIARRSDRVVPVLVRDEWFGLLPKLLGVKPGLNALIFDVEPGSLTIISRGDVRHIASGCSELMRKLIMTLAAGEASKESLALHLWGRSYNPLRHDGLIYGIVAKTRKLCGFAGDWIEACEVGYRLHHGVEVSTWQNVRKTAETRAKPVSISAAVDVKMAAALNTRQLTMIDWLKAGEAVDPKMAMSRLAISDATASRDLTGLLSYGLVKRLGKGRSTKYVLNADSSNLT